MDRLAPFARLPRFVGRNLVNGELWIHLNSPCSEAPNQVFGNAVFEDTAVCVCGNLGIVSESADEVSVLIRRDVCLRISDEFPQRNI